MLPRVTVPAGPRYTESRLIGPCLAIDRGGTRGVEMVSILVVDDDPLIRDSLSEALPLRWPGITVVTASDGEEALGVFSAHQPDVVILAVALPGLSGFEVLRQIRQVSDAPVVMLSRLGDEINQVRGLQLGADGYVAKSLGIDVLTAHLQAVLRRVQRSPRAHG